jgi:hypothetical protein
MKSMIISSRPLRWIALYLFDLIMIIKNNKKILTTELIHVNYFTF